MIAFLTVTCVILVFTLVASAFLLLRVARKVWVLEDQVEQSLDILDEMHQSIDRISQMDVMSDDPIVKQLTENIRRSRDAIFMIANKIGTSFGAEIGSGDLDHPE